MTSIKIVRDQTALSNQGERVSLPRRALTIRATMTPQPESPTTATVSLLIGTAPKIIATANINATSTAPIAIMSSTSTRTYVFCLRPGSPWRPGSSYRRQRMKSSPRRSGSFGERGSSGSCEKVKKAVRRRFVSSGELLSSALARPRAGGGGRRY